MMPRPGRNGFTIIELTFTIALIGILAAILLPSLARARENARRTSCMASLSQIGIALRIYADENDSELPWSGGNNNATCLTELLLDSGIHPASFICPSDAGHTEDELISPETGYLVPVWNFMHNVGELGLRASYEYLGAYTVEPIRYPPPTRGIPKVPVMWDHFPWELEWGNHASGGANVLWLDGSVEYMHRDEFAEPGVPRVPEGFEFLRPQPQQPLPTLATATLIAGETYPPEQ